MIERYVEILKEKKRYRIYGVTELAHHGSQSAFDALLELKRQLDFGEINLNHIGINPYIELLELTDRGMIKENYENFKLYLNKIISSFPLYGFLYSTYFLEEYNGFLCQTNNDQKIEIKEFGYLLLNVICKTEIIDEYEKSNKFDYLSDRNDDGGCAINLILDKGYRQFLKAGYECPFQCLFDFTYLMEDKVLKILKDKETIKLNSNFFKINEMVEKTLIIKDPEFENLKNYEIENINYTINNLNRCYDRWECWNLLLKQAHRIYNQTSKIEDCGIFDGWDIEHTKSLSKIGEALLGIAINVAELGHQFLEIHEISEDNINIYSSHNEILTPYYHEIYDFNQKDNYVKINFRVDNYLRLISKMKKTSDSIIKINPEVIKLAKKYSFKTN